MAEGRGGGDEKPALLVSACLLGVACNHEGRGSWRAVVSDLEKRYRLVPVCPEVLGGLTTPRPAAEIQSGDGADVLAGRAVVTNGEGGDVTAAYRRGGGGGGALAPAPRATPHVVQGPPPSL